MVRSSCPRELWIYFAGPLKSHNVNHQKFLKAARKLREQGGRLMTFTVVSGRTRKEFDLRYFFEVEGQVRILETRTVRKSVPSLFSYYSNSDFPEREASQEHRIKFVGNPNLPVEAG